MMSCIIATTNAAAALVSAIDTGIQNIISSDAGAKGTMAAAPQIAAAKNAPIGSAAGFHMVIL